MKNKFFQFPEELRIKLLVLSSSINKGLMKVRRYEKFKIRPELTYLIKERTQLIRDYILSLQDFKIPEFTNYWSINEVKSFLLLVPEITLFVLNNLNRIDSKLKDVWNNLTIEVRKDITQGYFVKYISESDLEVKSLVSKESE